MSNNEVNGQRKTKHFLQHQTIFSSPKTAFEYNQKRQKLLRQDSLQSFDASIILSSSEEIANRKLIVLQKEMIEHYDSVHFFPPAHYFYKSKEHIYSTDLFKLLKKMPKGGIHHLHSSAGGSFRWMVNRALEEPQCYVYWLPDNKEYIQGQLQFFRAGEASAGFYLVKTLKDSIAAFADKLYDLLTFDVSISKDSADIWGEFGRCFKRIGGFASYQPVFEDLYAATFDSLAVDGVQHVEIRTSLRGSLYDLKHPPGSFPYDSIIRYYDNAANRVRTARDPDFTFKLIYQYIRSNSLEAIKEDLSKAFAIRKRYPNIIKAYDLAGHEDPGHTTQFFRDAWVLRDSLSKVYKIDMPVCLHDGESDWQHIDNLYDAAVLNTPRIGHGFNVSFFPSVENVVRNQNICIEVSPLSNQILGYVRDLRIHPAHAWIKHGIQISINCDDPAIFDYVGVTPDYWSIFLAWELNLRSLKKLAMNSIQYSLLNKDEKKHALEIWQKRWDTFINDINKSSL